MQSNQAEEVVVHVPVLTAGGRIEIVPVTFAGTGVRVSIPPGASPELASMLEPLRSQHAPQAVRDESMTWLMGRMFAASAAALAMHSALKWLSPDWPVQDRAAELPEVLRWLRPYARKLPVADGSDTTVALTVPLAASVGYVATSFNLQLDGEQGEVLSRVTGGLRGVGVQDQAGAIRWLLGALDAAARADR